MIFAETNAFAQPKGTWTLSWCWLTVGHRLQLTAIDWLDGHSNELSSLAYSETPKGVVHFLQGQAFRAMENYSDAIDPLTEALRFEPDNIHIHLALGWCYKRVGRLDLAIQALEDAMELMPDEGIIHYNLACYWSLANNARLAVRYLDQSFELDPNYREMVDEEVDFDPIREDPGFQAAISVIV